MIALILAAGSGSRLKINRPKGLLNIYNQPLIKYSIDCIVKSGVSEILVVTGFGHEYYKKYFEGTSFPIPVRTILNEKYSDFGSLYSMYLGLKSLESNSDILILDADIIYNIDEFISFVDSPETNSVFVTNVPEARYDACYVDIGHSEELIRISKNINYVRPYQDQYWEHIGIVKSSSNAVKELMDYCEVKLASDEYVLHDYDYAFESIKTEYKVLKFKDYVWSEIDDSFQLQNVITNVVPRLNLFSFQI